MPQRPTPNDKQKSIINIIYRNGVQVGDYSTSSPDELVQAFKNAKSEGKFCMIPTGDKADTHYDNVMLVNPEDVIMFSVANISRIASNRGIIGLQ